MSSDGLWLISEGTRQFKPRKHSRYWQRFEIGITRRDHETRTLVRDTVFTREVSAGGMSIWGNLDVEVGEKVKIICREYDFFSNAYVRNRTTSPDDESRSTIHLEFIDGEFPVGKLLLPGHHEDAERSARVEKLCRQIENAAADREAVTEPEISKEGQIIGLDDPIRT